ncbi:DUF3168 domain-containing protein [Vreelandella boliviensis]|uniref:DUF3168 domain-containing protein n=1 Tax=Vreelandella boliviensis TaxID=223527 RepID=UPI001B8D7910|nr:DUF3168 domain-containing protein [Halomonas boliviensis]MBS3670196.1 DUF3168 domain-containing protein [Halomonas boliviensis]
MPPLFAVCAADAGVTALLGTDPVRFFPFGKVPQDTAKPYAVHQVLNGIPENYLDEPPDTDEWNIQIDIYGTSDTSVIAVLNAMRRALEPHCYIERLGGTSVESSTKLETTSFDVSWYYPTR